MKVVVERIIEFEGDEIDDSRQKIATIDVTEDTQPDEAVEQAYDEANMSVHPNDRHEILQVDDVVEVEPDWV